MCRGVSFGFFFSSRRRHTRCALVTGVQTCALPISAEPALAIAPPATFKRRFELVSEIDHVEALLFPLRRLAFELQAWLRTRNLGVHAVRLRCEHPQRRRSSFTLRRSDESRVGNECVSTCISLWPPYH